MFGCIIDSATMQGLLGGERRLLEQWPQGSGYPDPGSRAGFDVEVRTVKVSQQTQQPIEIGDVHVEFNGSKHQSRE